MYKKKGLTTKNKSSYYLPVVAKSWKRKYIFWKCRGIRAQMVLMEFSLYALASCIFTLSNFTPFSPAPKYGSVLIWQNLVLAYCFREVGTLDEHCVHSPINPTCIPLYISNINVCFAMLIVSNMIFQILRVFNLRCN